MAFILVTFTDDTVAYLTLVDYCTLKEEYASKIRWIKFVGSPSK